MKLTRNVGTTDRFIRLLIAALFSYLYFSGTAAGLLGIILLVLGVILVLVSLVSFCPLYLPFKVNTNKS